MPALRTVLCPVDFSAATDRQIQVAGRLCRLFGARLVVHHNLEEMPAAAAVGWMYAAEHRGLPSEAEDERRLRELLDAIPAGIETEGRLTHGLPGPAVLDVGRHVGADLLVLATHNDGADAHTSVTEEVIERADCVVLALHEPTLDGECASLDALGEPGGAAQRVLVPTDLGAESVGAVRFALGLAERLPVELHLLHVVEGHGRHEAEERRAAEAKLAALVPPELAGRVELHVAAGDPATEIAAAAQRLGASSIVMGEHTRAPLRRWLTRDTSRALLHRACCPVWYVPAAPRN